jgi:hypothetical protein
VSALFERKIHQQAGSDPTTSLGRFTIGHLIDAIMSIDNEVEAREFYESYVKWIQEHEEPRRTSVFLPGQVAAQNIGWCFGEGMAPERIAMWRRATPAAHPVLPITEDSTPSAEECFEAGMRLGQRRD